jgi:hypothetical protein
MEDVHIVKRLETSYDLNENPPYLLFRDVMLALGALSYFLKQISIINILHYDAIQIIQKSGNK